MMQRDVHLKPKDLLDFFQIEKGDFGRIALVSGDMQRTQMCLDKLENPVKNFTFLDYSFWTGSYMGKDVTVGNGGLYSPDSAFVTELLCCGGIDILIRLGSCGSLRQNMQIGDIVVAEKAIRGEGTSRYYVDDDFVPVADRDLTELLYNLSSQKVNTHKGTIWTTDALFRETKELVNSNIEKGAIAVDMIASSFLTIANLYKKKNAAILTVSDNLITGELGFLDQRFIDAQIMMIDIVFETVEESNVC